MTEGDTTKGKVQETGTEVSEKPVAAKTEKLITTLSEVSSKDFTDATVREKDQSSAADTKNLERGAYPAAEAVLAKPQPTDAVLEKSKPTEAVLEKPKATDSLVLKERVERREADLAQPLSPSESRLLVLGIMNKPLQYGLLQKDMELALKSGTGVEEAFDKSKAAAKVQEQLKTVDDEFSKSDTKSGAGQLGEKSTEALKLSVRQLEQVEIPNKIRELSEGTGSLPAGLPTLKSKADGRTLTTAKEISAAATKGDLVADLGFDFDKTPTRGNFRKAKEATEWLAEADKVSEHVAVANQGRQLAQFIKDSNLPKGWLPDANGKREDDPEWIKSASRMVELNHQTSQHLKSQDYFARAATNGDIKFVPPPNAHIDRDPKGNIVKVKLDLPETLDVNDPRAKNMRSWLSDNAQQVRDLTKKYADAIKNPDDIVSMGSHPAPDSRVKIGRDGKFIATTAKDYQLTENEKTDGFTLQDANLIKSRYEVKDDGGKVRITQTIQAQDVPWYGYRNKLGVDNVGQPKVIERSLEPGEPVPVKRANGEIEFVQARDLAAYKSFEQLRSNVEDVLVVAMDVGMTLTGTIEMRAGLTLAKTALAAGRAAERLGVERVASLAAQNLGRELITEGAEMSFERALVQTGHGAVRTGLGLTGVLGNDGANQNESLAEFNTWRGRYFMAEMYWGSVGKPLTSLGRAESAAKSLSAPGALTDAVKLQQQIEKTPYLSVLHKAGERTLHASGVAFTGVLADELSQEIRVLNEGRQSRKYDKAVDALRDTTTPVTDKLGQVQPAKVTEGEAKQQALTQLESVSSSLRASAEPATSQKIADIEAKAKELAALDANDPRVVKFKRELKDNMWLSLSDFTHYVDSTKNIKSKMPLGAGMWSEGLNTSPERVRMMQSPTASAERVPESMLRLYPFERMNQKPSRREIESGYAEMQTVIDGIQASKNKEVLTASAAALLYLSSSKDAKDSDVLVSSKYADKFRPGQRYEIEPGDTKHIGGSDAVVSLSRADVTRLLSQSLEITNGESQLPSVRLASADMLARSGKLTAHEHASILMSVIDDPRSTKQDRMDALSDKNNSRLGVLAGRFQLEEAAVHGSSKEAAYDLASQGTKVRDIKDSLLKRASDVSEDPDVRAMAAATVFALEEPQAEKRASLLARNERLWQQRGTFDGEFSKQVQTQLRSEMSTPLATTPAGKLNSERFAVSEASRTESALARSDAALMLTRLEKSNTYSSETVVALAKALKESPDVRTADAIMSRVDGARFAELAKTDPVAAKAFLNEALRFAAMPLRNDYDLRLSKGRAVPAVGYDSFAASYNSKLSGLASGSPFEDVRKQYTDRMLATLQNDQMIHFPKTTTAAIDSLADSKTPEARALVRSMVTALPELPGSNLPTMRESNPRVRAAAIDTLAKMNDEVFLKALPHLHAAETEAATKAMLGKIASERGIALTEKPGPVSLGPVSDGAPHPDNISKSASASFLRSELVSKAFPELGSFGQKEQESWLSQNYPLLSSTKMFDQQKKLREQTTGGWRPGAERKAAGEQEYRSQLEALHAQRKEQWVRLTDQAAKGGEEGAKAKVILMEILAQPKNSYASRMATNDISSGQLAREGRIWHETPQDWSARAGDALRRLTEPGVADRELTRNMIALTLQDISRRGFESSGKQDEWYATFSGKRALDSQTQVKLLEAWTALNAPNSSGTSRDSVSTYAEESALYTPQTVFAFEFGRAQDPNDHSRESVQLALTKSFGQLPGKTSSAYLQELARTSPYQSVRDASTEALTQKARK